MRATAMIGEDSLEDSVDGRSVPQMGFSKVSP